MKIIDIRPYPKNGKKHTKKQIEQVANSIKEFGMNQPIVVDKNGIIIVGHGRYEACKLLGIEPEIKVLDISEEKANAYRLADNKLNESEWDMKLVIEELKTLTVDLQELTGFDKDLLIEPNEADDLIPETPIEPKSKLGDLYELGSHRVLCGDSTQPEAVLRLMDGKKADMVFTDPPYGIDYSGGRPQVDATKTYGKLKNDDLQGIELGNLVSQVFSFNKNQADVYICVSPIMQTPFLNYIEDAGKKVDAVIVWDKKNAGLGYMAYRRQTEFILFIKGGDFKKGDKSDFDLWSIGKDNTSEYLHGTQKPVALPSRAILNSSKEEDIVLDLFLGSGSTLIACEKTRRICYGMELDPKYVDVIVQRYVDYTGVTEVKKNGIIEIWNKTVKTIK